MTQILICVISVHLRLKSVFADAFDSVTADGLRLIYRVRVVLDIRGAAARRIKHWRSKSIGIRARRSKLRDEHSAVDVSVAAAATVNLALTKHHDHAVEVEVSIECESAGYDQRSLPRGI